MTIKSYQDLHVWQKAIALAEQVYAIMEQFPKREWYGLANQLRRSAVSVASNIAEGSVRGSKEFAHVIVIARGSLAELETQLIIALKRNYLSSSVYAELEKNTSDISRMAMGLLRSITEVANHKAQGTKHKAPV